MITAEIVLASTQLGMLASNLSLKGETGASGRDILETSVEIVLGLLFISQLIKLGRYVHNAYTDYFNGE